MRYRVGRKQNRAILDENGVEVALFKKSQERLAKETCRLLNIDTKEVMREHFLQLREDLREDNGISSKMFDLGFRRCFSIFTKQT